MNVTAEERDERAPGGEDQLEWEKRLGMPVGIAAGLAAVLVLASFAAQIPLLRDKTKNEAETLRSVHDHATGYVLSGIFQMFAVLLVAVVFWYLFRATKYRRERTPAIALILGIAGPVVFAIAGAIGPFVIKHFANEFVSGANQTNQHAKDLVNGTSASAFSIITPAAGLAFAFAMVMNNVNAMRVGLLSAFAGVIGIIGGVLFVIPLGPPQILLFFWLVSLAVVILDRWPGGRGPAWASGKAMKWPSAAERRGLPPRQPRGARRAPEPEPEVVDVESDAAAQSRSSRKRKRKQGRKH
jgi:hypothetical protein